MLTDILYQVLLAVLIIVAIVLTIDLWRFNNILKRLEDVSAIAHRRAKEVDRYLASAQATAASYLGSLKGFALSFEFMKILRDRLMDLKKNDNKKGESDDK
ncbi:MAG: hypothetical protein WCT32_03300 [Patescibacteria group bacterium]